MDCFFDSISCSDGMEWLGRKLYRLYENKVLSSLVIFIAPWYMPLLFVLAGMSTRYAMKNRSYGQFAIERVKKLLIPLITGGFTVVALMTYMSDKYHNNYSGSFLSIIKFFNKCYRFNRI